MTARPLIWLALAQLAIGAAGVFARLALTATGPLTVGALRLGIAAVPVAAIAMWHGRYRRLDPATEWRLALAGAVLALHFATWFASLQHASVAVATLIVCSSPIFTEGWATLRSRHVRPLAIASIVLAIVGVAIVAGVPSRTETPLGIALAICGACCFAAYLLLVRASDARYTTLAVIGRTYPIAAIVLAGGAWLVHGSVPPASAGIAWGGILALAFVSQLFGHTALNAAVRTLSVTFVATTTLLEPVIAAIAAAFVFGERPASFTAVGAALILLAIGLAIRAERPSAAPNRGNQPLFGNNPGTMGDDSTLGEKMNRGMGLDPGFTLDRPNLVDSVRDMSDDTTKRAQKNLDQQRQNQADVEAIAAEMAAESEPPETLPSQPEHRPSMDVPHLHEYTIQTEPEDGA